MKTNTDAIPSNSEPLVLAAEPECRVEAVNSVRPSIPVTPMDMLSMAVSQGADLDKLQKLMDLQERWEANQAKNAFVVALNAFKMDPPSLTKNKHVSFTNSAGKKTEYDHATLDQVSLGIGKALSIHGLSHRWNVEQNEKGRIKVTCILTHALGHSESVSLEGGSDESGGKNAIQGIGSTVAYLERYTLLAATGMAVQDQDDDGNGPSSNAVEFVMQAKDRDEAIERFGVEYKLAGQAKNQRLQRELIGARDQRIEQLKKAVKP